MAIRSRWCQPQSGNNTAIAKLSRPKIMQMNLQKLTDTAKALVADDKGLLAMDESNPTCNKRFAKLAIPQTVDARHQFKRDPARPKCLKWVHATGELAVKCQDYTRP